MPANLSATYLAAEKKFKEAKEPREKILCLEEMLREIPKHKGTEKMQGDIKRRIASLRERIEEGLGKKKGFSFRVPREGAGQVTLVGAPNSGKSSILKNLTHAEPEVAPYPFTTHEPLPGMMPYKDIKIQLVDLPPISEVHSESWVADMIKASDMALCVINMQSDDPVAEFDEIKRTLEKFKLALVNSKEEYSAPLDFRFTIKKTLILVNKMDSGTQKEMLEIFKSMLPLEYEIVEFSSETHTGFDSLPEAVFRFLNIIRVYTKEPGKHPDMHAPFTIPVDSTLHDFAKTVHHDFAENLKFARIWGSAKFEGQQVKHDFILHDGDIVELHI